jgi:hypothetical protein
MSLPPPPPPVQRFVSARPVVVASAAPSPSQSSASPPPAPPEKPLAPAPLTASSTAAPHTSWSAAGTSKSHIPTAQASDAPPFDIEDIESLRAENRLLHQRLAVFLQPVDVSDSVGPIQSLDTSDPISASVMRGLVARVRQLEGALQWECARREDAEEKLQAALRIVAALSD